MPFVASVVKIMIASPCDVTEERRIVRDVINTWNNIHAEDRKLVLLSIGWETHSTPTMGDRPQAIVNKQVLANCDLLVAVFWTRIGSPTGVAVSGTVEEIEEHLNSGKAAMLYFSSAPVKLDIVDNKQYKALEDFKKKCRGTGYIESFESLDEFQDKFSRQLSQKINELFPNGIQHGSLASAAPTEPILSPEAKELLIETAVDGNLMRGITSEGLYVQANGKNFVKEGDVRSEARWEDVVNELENLGLIKDRGYQREVFVITGLGFQMVDKIQIASVP